jgi:hypothetical protein
MKHPSLEFRNDLNGFGDFYHGTKVGFPVHSRHDFVLLGAHSLVQNLIKSPNSCAPKNFSLSSTKGNQKRQQMSPLVFGCITIVDVKPNFIFLKSSLLS